MRMHQEEWEGHVQEKEEGGGCEVCWSTVFISGFVVGPPLTGFMPQYYSSDIHTVYTHGSIWLTHLMYICLSVCQSVCQSVCLSVCLCVYLSVCLRASALLGMRSAEPVPFSSASSDRMGDGGRTLL